MDMSDMAPLATPALRGVLRHDEPMSRHVSWRAGGKARVFFRPADLEDLQAFLASRPPSEPVLFVGLGSNLLVRDGGFDGAVVFTHHALTGIGTCASVGPKLLFSAGAGVPAPHLARFVAQHGGAGAEWMAGIPGTVGGALAMNAGCYGGETWNHVVSVRTIDGRGVLRTRTAADYEIGYRHVAARAEAAEWFVAGAFALRRGRRGGRHGAHARRSCVKRVATQPLNQPNAGSVFRNPPGDHAARLIESCGLKGYTVGGAQVSTKHANFIVNLGDGDGGGHRGGSSSTCRPRCSRRTGIELVREVRIVGRRGGIDG